MTNRNRSLGVALCLFTLVTASGGVASATTNGTTAVTDSAAVQSIRSCVVPLVPFPDIFCLLTGSAETGSAGN